MNGSILDTACAISIDSQNQTIEMAAVPMSNIERDGVGPEQLFTIQLINCTLTPVTLGRPDWSHFQMTFTGATANDGELFSVVGDAQGLGLSIVDNWGNRVIPGQPMVAQPLHAGNIRLNYRLRLEANHQHLKPGDYQSVIRFNMDYY
ncbi:type 1 fimbrial protein [Hafnia alvei]|uniref:Type 1 fimbrial protein n=1 Tax=Hafnia alvei TaxID=569 RepID=A0ABD7Q7I4_HAFAL|nr:type 1 fimbrial protein [Hafnia alvei]